MGKSRAEMRTVLPREFDDYLNSGRKALNILLQLVAFSFLHLKKHPNMVYYYEFFLFVTKHNFFAGSHLHQNQQVCVIEPSALKTAGLLAAPPNVQNSSLVLGREASVKSLALREESNALPDASSMQATFRVEVQAHWEGPHSTSPEPQTSCCMFAPQEEGGTSNAVDCQSCRLALEAPKNSDGSSQRPAVSIRLTAEEVPSGPVELQSSMCDLELSDVLPVNWETSGAESPGKLYLVHELVYTGPACLLCCTVFVRIIPKAAVTGNISSPDPADVAYMLPQHLSTLQTEVFLPAVNRVNHMFNAVLQEAAEVECRLEAQERDFDVKTRQLTEDLKRAKFLSATHLKLFEERDHGLVVSPGSSSPQLGRPGREIEHIDVGLCAPKGQPKEASSSIPALSCYECSSTSTATSGSDYSVEHPYSSMLLFLLFGIR